MSAATPFYEVIDGEEVQGWVAPEGRSFRAYADFRGGQVLARGRTASDAVASWRKAANQKANE